MEKKIDSAVRKAIFEAYERHGIDLSTPSLLRSINKPGNTYPPEMMG
ncbi:MAG: hypothetical protein NWE75_02525 [Candidatus Bathyarchaeota archaeon]|nr:hypothetical protein [Candidatus Bathyarchaeota archaeon]